MKSLRQIAEEAGVSVATVSRVINNSANVSAETKAKVLAVLKDSDFGSSGKQENTADFAVAASGLRNPFVASIVDGIEKQAAEHDMNLLFIRNGGGPAAEREVVESLYEKGIRYCICFTGCTDISRDAAFYEEYTLRGMHFFLIDQCIQGLDADTILGDNCQGARQLTNYVIERGHRHIGYLAGGSEHTSNTQRVQGFLDAAADHGVDDVFVMSGNYNQQSGYERMNTLLSSSQYPSVVIAGNNDIALGAFYAVHERGLNVPKDISLVCFDEVDAAFITKNFFTTMAQPSYLMGCLAFEVMNLRMRIPDLPIQRLTLAPRLNEGSSLLDLNATATAT